MNLFKIYLKFNKKLSLNKVGNQDTGIVACIHLDQLKWFWHLLN